MNLQFPINSSVNARRQSCTSGVVLSASSMMMTLCLHLTKARRSMRNSSLVSDSIEESSFIGSVDDIIVYSKFMTKCLGYSGLTTSRRSRQKKIWNFTLLYKLFESILDSVRKNTIINSLGSIRFNPNKFITIHIN